MRFVAAYLLATLGGNQSPTKDDVRAILGSVGAEVEEGKLDALFKEVEGKDLAELLAAGREKFAFAPSAGAAMGASPAAAAGDAAAEEKKDKAQEKKEEEEEEEDLDMFSLFD
ncbi:60S acidic ribosomal protein P2B [Hordeum vulgare]|uniref:60S acidic ribosomal protein P2-C-like n=1 Tax=Hordeum vulgare subsp. vulgare TaxID=112509 RepID=UPI000296A346|nr:60S acidic ribosomal protein P2-C-like [Hordeum vulgare subsp. vulgare]KAE8817214.1 60S acidic ribosomal protein P2B [Hordeum vulgare]